MALYVAIIEVTDPDAVSLWFPDLPGCISGGDDVEEALESAPEALAFYAQELTADGRQLPHRARWTSSRPTLSSPTTSGDTRSP